MHARLTLCAIALLSLLSVSLMAGTSTATTIARTGTSTNPTPIMTCEDSCEKAFQAALQAAANTLAAARAAANAAHAAAYNEAAGWEALCQLPGTDPIDCIVYTRRAKEIRAAADAARQAALAAANQAHFLAVLNASDDYDLCIAICADPAIT